MGYDEKRGAYAKIESRIRQQENGIYEITDFCCKYKKSFVHYIKEYDADLHSIIRNCLYNYCETGKISFRLPNILKKGWNYNYIAKFIIQAIENEKNKQTFKRQVKSMEIKQI